jgi:peptidoglycan/LPS O-acetylase OafA/YrhL
LDDPTPRPLLDRRDTTVDGLRGIAALLVALHHVLRSDVFGRYWFHSVALGRMGVQLFFVISGYVIGALITNRASDPTMTTRFMARRLVRLTPPYYAAIALTLALNEVFRRVYAAGQYPELRADLLSCSLAYLCYPLGLPLYIPVAWTLEIELQFYLLACLLVPLAVSLGARGAWMVAAGLLALSPFAPEETALRYAAPFVIGMAIVAHRRAALGLRFLVALTVAIAAGWGAFLGEVETGAIVALGALAIAVGVPMPRPLVWLGGVSYPLYLLHRQVGSPIVRGVKLLGWPTLDIGWLILWGGLGIAGSILAAWLLHRFVEVPAVRWSHAVKVRGAEPTR